MAETITISLLEYERLNRENSELRTQILQLQDTVQKLETAISLLKGGKSSRTSSTAPSHDLARSNTISLRPASNRKSGGQPGHVGHTLSMTDTPDEVIEHHPPACEACQTDLHEIESLSFTRRQTVDAPPVFPIFTEHRSHLKICPVCSIENRGAFPERLRGPIQYGPNIEAMVGYLSVYQCLPYKRICLLFRDFFSLHISQGSIDNFLDSLSQKSNSAYEAIKARVQQSAVVGADETGCRVNGKKHWIHVWQTLILTLIIPFKSRGYKIFETYFKDGFPLSVYVSDCWASQLKVPAKLRQLCMAHLLRELTNFAENLKSRWSAQVKELFKGALELKKKMTEEIHYLQPPQEVYAINEKLDELLRFDCSASHSKEQAFIKRLKKHRQSIFTFLTCPDVPPDNNASERAIRNVKIKTKVSGQFRNADGKGADRYAKIRSVIETANKNGQEIYATLIDLANCKITGGEYFKKWVFE